MTLELKHLAPYLPYNLDFISYDGSKRCIHLLCTLSKKPKKSIKVNGWDIQTINGFKPILRPLSDLTKKIKHNGEFFVPSFIIDKIFNVDIDSNLIVYTFSSSELGENEYNIKECYYIFCKLFEWHFDVFGLIENNLAIDINTL